LNIKEIVQDNIGSRAYFSDKQACKFAKIKWIDGKQNYFLNEIYIYDKKTAFFSFTTGSLSSVIIESDENAKTQKYLFELIWNNIKT